MTTVTSPAPARERILGQRYAATTVGMFALIAFVAFEAMAVVTVMPTVADELDGVSLYALSFAAPLAGGVVGMVAAGMWSDLRGPAVPLAASMVLFALGLLVCGTAPSMDVLVAGRVLQGLGGGALTVGLYVVVGLVYPAVLQPAVFASFAAAWVLPSLFGPAVAALVADLVGWRWVFLGTVALVAVAGLLIAPALRGLAGRGSPDPSSGAEGTGSDLHDGSGEATERVPAIRLLWAVLAAVGALALELLGSAEGSRALLALVALAVVVAAVRPLVPRGTLTAARGLPAVISTRGLMSAGFFTAEAYIVFVLQEQWSLSPGRAGLALTCVGVTWAAASQVQSRLGERVSHERLMLVGSALVLVGTAALAASVWLHVPALLAGTAYVVAGAGMGLGYPRTGVAMLAASSGRDRGFNSAALSIADSLGAAVALALTGVVFTVAGRAGLDPFLAVFGVAVALAVAGLLAASRTGVRGRTAGGRVS